MTVNSGHVFISYARSDSPFEARLSRDLTNAQVPIWMDTREIEAGAYWDDELEAALLRAAKVVLILSPAACASTHVKDEIAFAKRHKKLVIPVLHVECSLPLAWGRIQHIDMRRDYEAGLVGLLGALRDGVGAVEAQVRASWLDSLLNGTTEEWYEELASSNKEVARYKLVDDHELAALLAQIQPSEADVAEGYETFVSHSGPVVRSRRVDAWLRQACASGRTIPLHLDDDVVLQIAQQSELTPEAARLVILLKCMEVQARQSGHRFENQEKLSLASDLSTGRPITAFRGSYYLSTATNELCCRCLILRGEEEHLVFQGGRIAPWAGMPPRLAPISGSLLGNHIGVSTIAHTSDDKLVLWVQTHAQQSVDRLAPTGSGSADWGDRSGDLLSVVRTSMERELREESSRRSGMLRADTIGATRVLGYYRWISRGGKPEFVGITKLKVPAASLHPDVTEVATLSEGRKPVFEATSLGSLAAVVSNLLLRRDLSTPLQVNLQCLRECLDDPSERQMLSRLLWAS